MISEKTISIVIPVYNSKKTIGTLVEQLQSILNGKYKFDIILINDGSQDRSFDALKDISITYDNIKVLDLSRNFGQHNAIMAGFNYANGDYVVTMDDDLQHPPEEILKLIKEIENHDVVYGYYKIKKHSAFKNFGSNFNNLTTNILLNKPKKLKFTSFRILKSYVVNELIKYIGPDPYIDGLIIRVTQNIGTVIIDHHDRSIGKSNYTLKKLVGLWLNGFLNFSVVPLRLFTYTGFIFASTGFLFALIIVIKKLFFNTQILGWASLMIAILIFSGIQLLSIGMVGEYIGRIFMTENQTPQYVVRTIIGGGEN